MPRDDLRNIEEVIDKGTDDISLCPHCKSGTLEVTGSEIYAGARGRNVAQYYAYCEACGAMGHLCNTQQEAVEDIEVTPVTTGRAA